ncbi:MAG: amidohydrolase [Proteobacteria bacterium]|mgnify:CR=1 FL=1|jgi:amidohydrolase|nr:amidohydrolase [Pseudomonadota bacterium]
MNEDIFRRMVAIRRDLHQHPELARQEVRTARQICAHLAELGIKHHMVAKTGVVADLPGPAKPHIALRADMDALPIGEETELSYRSQIQGLMHACGHDGHVAMLLGAAELLIDDTLPAPVRLIFQPAEEIALGAQAVIADGVMEDVGMIFSGHLDNRYLPGQIAISHGVVNASADHFFIEIKGKSAHAARPHLGVDALVAGCALAGALQTIVSREINPAIPAVVTVGTFRAGTAPNLIASSAELEGTLRSNDAEIRLQLQRSLRRIARAVADVHGVKLTVNIDQGVPCVINDPEITVLARTAAMTLLGANNVLEMHSPNMGAEDFSYYLQHAPGCYVRFGAKPPDTRHPAHSSQFDIDEAALWTGATFFRQVALDAGQVI